MLARADSTGFVEASVPGLARVANLSMDEVSRSLEILESPDPHSKNPDMEGRRIVKVKGGWMVLNYEDYRNRRSDEERREYMRKYMQDYRRKQRVNDVNSSKPQLAQGEGETEAEREAETEKSSSLPAVRKAPPQPSISDDQWREELKSDPTYGHVDIDMEFGKMRRWCQHNNKEPTRKRFVNWINRIDKPLSGSVEPVKNLSFKEQERERDAAVHKTINPTRGW